MLRPITEVGNLLSLYPKIHRLRADAKEDCCLPNSQWDFVSDGKGALSAPAARFEGEALGIHTHLYGLLFGTQFHVNWIESLLLAGVGA
jgi:hypothetical protein